MQAKIQLYGTEFCHLCDKAEAILDKAGVAIVRIDIAEDDKLLEKYGTRIPVLRRDNNDTELGWPFDAVAVARFLM